MKALLIDPIARTITAIELPDGLEALREALGCTWVDRAMLTPSEDLWIDDEGRLTYPNPRGYFAIGGNTFAGRGVVLGHAWGDSVDTRLTPDHLAIHVTWLDTPAAEDVAPGFEVYPL